MNEDSKKTLLIIAGAFAVVAFIYYYFQGEVEEQNKNDVDGDSFNVNSEKKKILADTTLSETEKAKATAELDEISALRIEYKSVFGVEAPSYYTLTQLRQEISCDAEEKFLAACTEYKKSIGAEVPKNLKTAAAVNQAMSDKVSQMRTEYSNHFKKTAPESMGYLAMKTAIESDKARQESERKAKVEAWNIRKGHLKLWANWFLECLYYTTKCKPDWYGNWQTVSAEFNQTGLSPDEKAPVNDGERLLVYHYADKEMLQRGWVGNYPFNDVWTMLTRQRDHSSRYAIRTNSANVCSKIQEVEQWYKGFDEYGELIK